MNPILVAAFLLSGLLSIFFIFKLLSSQRSFLEKCVFFAVLLIPLVGPLLYLFLSEDMPSQAPVLRNNGPRGAYTNWMIAIQAIMTESDHKQSDEQKNEVAVEDGGENKS